MDHVTLAAGPGLPRVTVLDTEFQRAIVSAELTWVQSVADDLAAGRLTWSAGELLALAATGDQARDDEAG